MSPPVQLEQLRSQFVDHHCHGLVLHPLDRPGFEALMNEAAGPAPAGTSYFDSLLGFAIRRWCAPVLDLEPHVDSDDYLQRRRELGVEASRRLLTAAGIEVFLVDTGIGGERLCPPQDLAELAGGTAHEVVRLETLAEGLLATGLDPQLIPDRIEAALSSTTAVGAKTVAAYRAGLELTASRPAVEEVTAELAAVRPEPDGRLRIAHPGIHSWLAWTAIEHGLPLQIHAGFGDADLDLRLADPLLLTAFLRASEERAVPVLLLHNYPYHRNAGYLAQVYSHVHLDLGLAVHNTGARSRAIIAEALELAPFDRLLFSTDAYGLAELYFLGALLFRRGFTAALGELLDAGDLTWADAERVAALVARGNADRVYGLSRATFTL